MPPIHISLATPLVQREHVCWRLQTYLLYIVVEISPKVKNLGVIFDQSLSMQFHVDTATSACYAYIRSNSSFIIGNDLAMSNEFKTMLLC